ncbi:alpha/beta hydrolase [Halococcus sp. PRR34]|uniref:alpha/beta fold hydrolase n=1 Tax=Halococcus sp. PRR34 TaxID=3020830 RepID=UPI0023606C30|nr:alpha/beta hydrolase [Halococcus sp. PRR34]
MTLPDGWTTDAVRVNGVDLQCYRIGNGPPLVMAHGLFDSGQRWIPLAEDLADDYEVVAYDARGHGQSDAPKTGYSLDDRITDLRAVVHELDLSNPILLGHSMGGATVAWAAAKYPDFPRAVVLEDPEGLHDQPDLNPDERAGVVHERLEEVAGQTVQEIVEEHFPDPDQTHARRLATASLECSPHVAEIAREGYPSPLVNALSEISCRTLVLRSDLDVDRRVRDLDASDTVPDGRLVHISDAGHYVFRDEYEAAYTELRTFLQRI